jgi:small neutral amino acid transporter SnatA (MarC family)
MNAAQRKVHANAWTVLGGLLLLMLAIALMSRPDEAQSVREDTHSQQQP